MSQIYTKEIFEQRQESDARTIILTPERNIDTAERWARETPDTIDVFLNLAKPSNGSVVLDYGCGIGRLAKELLSRLEVTVIGVDIAEQMRVKAISYVGSSNFVTMPRETFRALVYANALHVDFAYSVYTLQHIYDPGSDLAVIGRASRHGLFTINAKTRAVPVTDRATGRFSWVDDGIDVRQLCLNQFSHEVSWQLNEQLYALHDQQFCSFFTNDAR